LYKILYQDVFGPFSNAPWDTSGEWMPDVGVPIHCESGYYGVQKKEIEYWLVGISSGYRDRAKFYSLYEIELDGMIREWGDKIAGSTARVVRRLGNIEEFLKRPKIKEVKLWGDFKLWGEYKFVTYTCGHYRTFAPNDTIEDTCLSIHIDLNKIPELSNEHGKRAQFVMDQIK
jgi:hypothetical protein